MIGFSTAKDCKVTFIIIEREEGEIKTAERYRSLGLKITIKEGQEEKRKISLLSPSVSIEGKKNLKMKQLTSFIFVLFFFLRFAVEIPFCFFSLDGDELCG